MIGGGRDAARGPRPAGRAPARRAYVDPLAHASVTPERIDQGVDYSGTGPIDAIGNGTIEYLQPAGPYGWPGN